MNIKTFFYYTLFFCLSAMPPIFTMQRSDDPNVLNDVVEFAKNMPYATGVLLCKDSNMGTVVFLNETTAITAAHHFKGRERSAHIVVASDEIGLWYNKYDYSWDLTLQNIKNSGAPWACVKQQYSMPKFVKSAPNKEQKLNTLTPEYILKLRESWEDAEVILFSRGLGFNNLCNKETYNMYGSDISVLKLRTPITLKKKTVKLQAISKELITSYKAYSFGFPGSKCLNDQTVYNQNVHKKGEESVRKLSLMCFLAHNLQQSNDGNYAYSKLYSIGGQDEQFIIENLPALDENRFIGLMMGGMSGGPLLFQISQEEYVLGGLNMQTKSQDAKAGADLIISALEKNFIEPNNENKNSIVRQWQNEIKRLGKIPWPIYNIFQLITQKEVDFIEKIMAL